MVVFYYDIGRYPFRYLKRYRDVIRRKIVRYLKIVMISIS